MSCLKRPGLAPALKSISFSIAAGEKVSGLRDVMWFRACQGFMDIALATMEPNRLRSIHESSRASYVMAVQ
eukprot:4607029-Amphidinium_carterae.2